MQNATPMYRQYLEIKQQYPGTILFFRLGDFYEMFNEDAVTGSRELEITLTARQKDSPNPIPMCGVPHHAAATYIARLVRKGYRVAVCEQAEEAGKGVKLVRREVVRVITPGTAIDAQLLESKESVYLAAVCGSGDTFGLAFLELSTGELLASEHRGPDSWAQARAEIESFAPREILYPASLERLIEASLGNRSGLGFDRTDAALSRSIDAALTGLGDRDFDRDEAGRLLKAQLKVTTLNSFGLEGHIEAIRAAGATLAYARQTQRAAAEHISTLKFLETHDHMVLDAVTVRNLELVESRGDSNRKTLFGVIDRTVTGMGARLLRSWLLRPSVRRSEIAARLEAVRELADPMLRDRLRYLLKEVADLERLVGRLNLGTASARDLLALDRSLAGAPAIKQTLSDARAVLLRTVADNIQELPEVRDLIGRAISDEPPLNFADGGVIRDGFDRDLDELRAISRDGKQIIAGFEEDERRRTGISNLKIRFNNVFGYFIEISKGNLTKVPEDYERRQTLANAERFTTPQLKEWERKVLGAEERIARLETDIFQSVRARVREETPSLQATARSLALTDALASLAETAAARNFVEPEIHEADEIAIKGGRHPIVEAFAAEEFIPNDVYLNNSTDRLLIVTGPNMGGKSTLLRQIAIIQILGQIGSFVPATSARLPIIDRVWTRVGASDDLAGGRSTFMVEMTETATILHNSTPRSLILLDEIGRGTSTFDGLSIAWAVAEYLHNSPEHSAKTMFATHYHELTELAELLPGARNFQVTATERDGDVVFLHKLQKGKASKSYGIAVARLAGLPQSVIERAKSVLAKLEQYELAVFRDGRQPDSPEASAVSRAGAARTAAQVSLFAISNESLIDELRELDTDSVSDLEAREILIGLKRRVI